MSKPLALQDIKDSDTSGTGLAECTEHFKTEATGT